MSNYTEALKAIGGLSHPSKMPTASWSLSANSCRLGSKLSKLAGSTCSGCYARKGCYTFASTRHAMARREAILLNALANKAAQHEFVANFATVLNTHLERTRRQIRRTGKPGKHDGRFFRWHDSGDLLDTRHLYIIARIAINCPDVKFWLPTREVGYVQNYLAAFGELPSNLVIRLSLPYVDKAIPRAFIALKERKGITISGVHTDRPRYGLLECRGVALGTCGACRACWEDAKHGISYRQH